MRGMRTKGTELNTDFGVMKKAGTTLPLERMQSSGVEKAAVYFDQYDVRVTVETKAGISDVSYSEILNALRDAGVLYKEERRYNLQPDRVMIDILIHREDIELITALNKELEPDGITFTINTNISESIEAIKSPVRTQYDYGELDWKKGDLQEVKEAGDTIVLPFKDCDVTYDRQGKFISAINRESGEAVSIPAGFQKEFGLMVAKAGACKITAAISQRRLAAKIAGCAKPVVANLIGYKHKFQPKELDYNPDTNLIVLKTVTPNTGRTLNSEQYNSWDEMLESTGTDKGDWLEAKVGSKPVANQRRALRRTATRLQKKAARLGNWEFDQHDPVWVLESSDDGSNKLVRK